MKKKSKIKEIKAEQRSDEWYEARGGKLTSSTFPDLIKTVKQRTEWNKTQLALLREVAVEIITGTGEESYTSKSMERGTEYEDEGRTLWAIENFEIVRKCGFFQYSEYIGGSPDGIIKKDEKDWGVFEIKCPMSKNHLRYELNPDELFKDYGGQVLGESFVTGLRNYVLVSYDPRFPDGRRFVEVSGTFKPEDYEALQGRLDDAINLIKEWI